MANKYLDNDGVLYLWNKIKSYVATAISGKVNSESGKGLSTNDYTDAEKNKLSGIESGAEKNVIESVKVNGAALTVTGKAVDIAVPTATSGLTNDSGFITLSQVPEGAVASTTTPSMDGTASAGSETAFARGDHVHPHDSTKVDKEAGKGLSTNDFTTAEKNKLAAFGAASDYALKSDISAMYKYKGSVATTSALPSSGNTTGDVYNVESSGMNYAWNGSEWDALGETFTITAITNAEIDSICT